MTRDVRLLIAGVAAAAALAAAPAVPARAAPAEDCADPGQEYRPVPWAQQLLAPERVWPFARGSGVTVAVLSSGVDASHPRLREVAAGFDAVNNRGPANVDCLGLGTQVAGVIAARQVADVGFVGLAPNVTILPVRVVTADDAGSTDVEPAMLARGIDWAAANGADVIDVPLAIYVDDPAVRDAVANAIDQGVTVVAAAGDRGSREDGNPTPYPAAYGQVIGVGAIDRQGSRWARSQYGGYVDLVAPGVGVVTLQREGGMVDVDGTGIASGQVAAAAALVRSRRGSLTPRQMAARLVATATPAPAGPEYGKGIVNPYAAVNDTLVNVSPVPLPALVHPADLPDTARDRARRVALIGAVVAAVVVIVVLAAAAALPRGRRRLWRPGMVAPPPHRLEPQEPGPPVMLFDEDRRGTWRAG